VHLTLVAALAGFKGRGTEHVIHNEDGALSGRYLYGNVRAFSGLASALMPSPGRIS
jgi:hypothetical protein